MHLIIVFIVIVIALLKGDWKNWERYYPTMLYMALATFIYEFISHNHFHLWELREGSNLTTTPLHLIHALIINPSISFVFLSNYPSPFKKQMFYTVAWMFIFIVSEWVLAQFDFISYHNGWHFGWSALFVTVMFPMLRLHHLHKLLAIILSVLFAVLYSLIFDYI